MRLIFHKKLMFSFKSIQLLYPFCVLAIAAGAFFLWEHAQSGAFLPDNLKSAMRVPLTEETAEAVAARRKLAAAATEMETFFTTGDGKPSEKITGTWSCFRGDHLDQISRDETPLNIPKTGTPPVLWEVSAGEGYAGMAVCGGCAYFLDYDMEKQQDALRCLSMDDGREVWRRSYPVEILRYHGMSRTIPAVSEEFIVTLGPKCHVMCVARKTGALLWFVDLKSKYGAAVPEWYAGQCPVLETDAAGQTRVILGVGGSDALLVAFNCATGEEIWRTPNPHAWPMTHASLTPMMLDGRKTWVYPLMRGVVGVDAQSGAILWEDTTWKGIHAMCPAPVVLPGDRVFCAGSYNAGSTLLTIQKNDTPTAENPLPYTCRAEYWRQQKFSSMQQTPILYQDMLLGVRERDNQLVCFDLTGKERWASGVKNRFGWGPYISAGGKFFLMNDTGTLSVGEVTASGFTLIARYEIFPDGVDSWGPMAFVDGRLLLRDLTRVKCLDFRNNRP